MSWQDLTVNVFLDRIADMPDREAKQQIELRKDRAILELNLIQQEAASANKQDKKSIGHEVQVAATDLARLNMALKEVNERLSNVSWQRAVSAVFGQEGYNQCRLWMATYDR